MQSAETVLGVLRERGRRGLPLERLYRQLFNPRLYLVAYKRLYANKGAMTPGVTAETVDGMSLAKIGRIIAAVRAERWRWRPVKRVHIPKRNGKRRALGLPTWSDKLLAEVVRMLLDAYYDPTTTPSSPTTPTGSDPDGAATPRSARSWRSGRGRTGSSRATSPSASTRLIAR